MISVKQTLDIHLLAIQKFGGANGVWDLGALESSLTRPFQTFGGEFLYQSIYEKAAALGQSIIVNHPFIDGNKRTGYILMESLIRFEGLKINSADDDLYNLVIDISTGSATFDQIVEWLKNNTIKTE